MRTDSLCRFHLLGDSSVSIVSLRITKKRIFAVVVRVFGSSQAMRSLLRLTL